MGKRNDDWDMEYSTSYLDEMVFLKSRKIRYTWVYTNESGRSVWKYKKNRELWMALADMYENRKYEV